MAKLLLVFVSAMSLASLSQAEQPCPFSNMTTNAKTGLLDQSTVFRFPAQHQSKLAPAYVQPKKRIK